MCLSKEELKKSPKKTHPLHIKRIKFRDKPLLKDVVQSDIT